MGGDMGGAWAHIDFSMLIRVYFGKVNLNSKIRLSACDNIPNLSIEFHY